MSASKPKESATVRTKPLLNRSEQEFVASRRRTVLQNLKKLQIQCSLDKVPNIALLGSGGGQRAMVGLLGSLVQLDKAGLLDCILYLSGVSGSTWCMASLYKEPDWSTKLESVKNRTIERLNGPAVSWGDAYEKLMKYYSEKDYFSLTDVWAVLAITSYVKEIDEHTLTEQRNKNNKDPFPIYTVIDKKFRHSSDEDTVDPWFEINPYEAGYSLTGKFVDTCDFGSQFVNGSKKKHQGESDMLYLQALCGSALGDEMDVKKVLWERIRDFFQNETTLETLRAEHEMSVRRHREMIRRRPDLETEAVPHSFSKPEHKLPSDDRISPSVDEQYQKLMDLVNRNISALNGEDPSGFDKPIRTNDFSGGKSDLISTMKTMETTDKRKEKWDINEFTIRVCEDVSGRITSSLISAWLKIFECMTDWIWGRKYNFLRNMTDRAVPAVLLQDQTRDYIDAGLMQNSPYPSVLRKERMIDLIISLDFSAGDPFQTVETAKKMCKSLNIPFPEVNTDSENKDKPKDFYVFEGINCPTVIHIPLFNTANCGDDVKKWQEKYSTFQGPYSPEMITELMEVAGKNISNNREKLKEQIGAVIEKKRYGRFSYFLNKDLHPLIPNKLI